MHNFKVVIGTYSTRKGCYSTYFESYIRYSSAVRRAKGWTGKYDHVAIFDMNGNMVAFFQSGVYCPDEGTYRNAIATT